jgi:hypothetical protein
MLAWVTLSVAIAASGPLQQKQVPLEAGSWPSFPLTEAAVAAGGATCVASVTTGAGGAVETVEVTGCPDPFLTHTRDALVELKYAAGFLKKNPSFQVVVPYTAPVLARRAEVGKTLGEKEKRSYTLEEAVVVGTPPSQIVKKDPFAPPGTRPGFCQIHVWIDDQGDAYAVEMSDCREEHRLAVEMAALAWKFEPYQQGGVAVPFRFKTRVSVHE